MIDNIIQLGKKNTLVFRIADENGVETGETLEFDLEDIELPLRYQELLEQNKKNKQWMENQINIISKRQDVKGKKLYSKNEEDIMKATIEFFKKEEEVYDMFLGKGGVKKLLNGRKLGWSSFREIDKIISKCIMPKLNEYKFNIADKIKNKYNVEENDNVLE